MKEEHLKTYPFLGASAENEYLLFPEDMETNENIFFHGTAEKNLALIIAQGFKILGNSPSVSFARTSALSLSYACSARNSASPNGVVIAVRYACLHKPYIKQEQFGLHVYSFDEQPELVGYCIVPAEYVYH